MFWVFFCDVGQGAAHPALRRVRHCRISVSISFLKVQHVVECIPKCLTGIGPPFWTKEWEKSREQRVAKLQKEMLKIERNIAADEDYVRRRYGLLFSHC